MRKYFLEIAVFICGAAVMMIELVGSRVLAPHVGTSTLIWTSLIGIILGFLSLGYAWGGRIADKKPEAALLSKIILAAAVWTVLIALFGDLVVILVSKAALDLRLTAVIATTFLFGFPAVLLGAVSPFAAKLRSKDLQSTGATIGMLYAISTIGSIVGTFLAGFYLVSYFSNTVIFVIIACLLVLSSLFISVSRGGLWKRGLLTLVFILIAAQSRVFAQGLLGPDFVDVNSSYGRIWIYDISVKNDPKETLRMMQINDETSSLDFVYKDGLAAAYTRYYRLAAALKPDMKKALMIGGAAYSFPKDFIKRNPDATLDVVEIDPKLTKLARTYFRLKDSPRLRIYHEDARTFINRTKEKYDVVYMDTFRSFSPPFQLITKECLGKVRDTLNEDGLVMANIISSVTGEKGQLLRAFLRTLKTIFPHVYVLAVHEEGKADVVQNFVVLAFKSPQIPPLKSEDMVMSSYLQKVWIDEIPEDLPVLRDDYAPVERYAIPMLQDMLKRRNNEMAKRLKRRVYAV